jgi:hypothetical protein
MGFVGDRLVNLLQAYVVRRFGVLQSDLYLGRVHVFVELDQLVEWHMMLLVVVVAVFVIRCKINVKLLDFLDVFLILFEIFFSESTSSV